MQPNSERVRMMRRLPAGPARPALRRASWVALLFGALLLGYVGYSFLDAEIYQVYASWNLDRSVRAQTTSPVNSPAISALESRRSPAPRLVEEPVIVSGSALGRISIPRLGLAVNILEGTDGKSLRRGVGHVTGTALPGEHGNIAIAGHRDTFFRNLRNIRHGDEILLTNPAGSYHYKVEFVKIVTPEDTSVLKYEGDSVLTLITCHPFEFIGSAPDRFIVRAKRIQIEGST